MTLKSLKILLAATALGVGALAYSGPADARVRGRTHYGWHYGWYKGWHRGPVVASDYDVAPRRARHHHDDCVVASDYDVAPRRACDDDYVVASDYVAPRAYDYGYCEPTYEPAYSYYAAPAVYAAPVVYTSGWYSPWGYGYGWPF